jgi:hypothetical protein
MWEGADLSGRSQSGRFGRFWVGGVQRSFMMTHPPLSGGGLGV